MPGLPGPADVLHAADALAGRVVRTPVLSSEVLDAWVGVPVRAKAEGLQVSGSFKVRGALHKVGSLDETALRRGLITVSAGNAALGAAWAARACGTKLTVVMPDAAVREKKDAVAGLGADVVTAGVRDAADAFERARGIQEARQLTFVHPYDDAMVVAGAATATMELLEDAPGLTRIYVPTSGGGLLAGAVLAREALGVDVDLVGVQPTGADAMVRSLAAGRPTAAPSISTVADGLTAPSPGTLNLQIIARAGVRVRTVPESLILAALAALVQRLRIVAEPSGAVALAGLCADLAEGAVTIPPGPVGVIVSGSNVSWRLLSEVAAGTAPAPSPSRSHDRPSDPRRHGP